MLDVDENGNDQAGTSLKAAIRPDTILDLRYGMRTTRSEPSSRSEEIGAIAQETRRTVPYRCGTGICTGADQRG